MTKPIVIDRPAAVRTHHVGWFVFLAGAGVSFAAMLTGRSAELGVAISHLGLFVIVGAHLLNDLLTLRARRRERA